MSARVELVQGRYLSDMGAHWILADQERFHQAYLSGAIALAELYHKQGQSPKAIETCQRVLAKDNTCEAIYRLLMEIYHRMGDRPSIVHVYKSCETAMQNTFHMPPSEETQALYQRLTA